MFQYSSLLCQVKPEEAIRQLLPLNLMDLLGLVASDLPEAVHVHENSVSTCTFTGKHGHICFSFDGIRLLIECYCGGLLIFRGAIRDRQLDATDGRSPLTAFPNSDPACNRLPHPRLLAAELSIYSWNPDPGWFLSQFDKPGTVDHFVADPDYYIWRNFQAQTFFPLFTSAMRRNRAPWQRSIPIPGAARYFVTSAVALLTRLGYHRVDEVPSWFNVVGFFKKLGFQFTYGEHAAGYDKIVDSLARSRFSNLTVQQQAWLVAVQNLPESLIPPSMRLGVRWPVTHTNQYWVRMHLDINVSAWPDEFLALYNCPPLAERADGCAAEKAEKWLAVLVHAANWEAEKAARLNAPAANVPHWWRKRTSDRAHKFVACLADWRNWATAIGIWR